MTDNSSPLTSQYLRGKKKKKFHNSTRRALLRPHYFRSYEHFRRIVLFPFHFIFRGRRLLVYTVQQLSYVRYSDVICNSTPPPFFHLHLFCCL